MTELDVVIMPDSHESMETIAEQATLAEELGYAHVSISEATDWNNVATLSMLAERTSEIGIANDVFSPYSRSPGLLIQTAAALQEVSGGRYRMGLGPSSPALVERWHGAEFDRPLRRLRESIEIVREGCSGGRLSYDGEVFELDGLGLAAPAPDPVPPLDAAVLGPKAVELAGRFADGWVPQLFTPDGLETRLADLRRGADLGSRSIDDVRVAPILRCCAMADRERAREIGRGQIAFLVGAYGPYYRQSVARQGYESITEEIHAAWQDRDIDAMAEALPDDLLDELAAVGTPAEVRERVETFGGIDGVDAVRVGFHGEMSLDEQAETLEALAALV